MTTQHDYILDNQSGANFRADLNDALEAIVSVNSGDSAPSTTYKFQYWIDTSTDPARLKQRNKDDNAWITLGEIGGQQLFPDGTDQKPSISFANDTDTGLRRDGANKISVVTDATDRLTVHPNGEVAINTDVPLGELHVTGNSVFQKDGTPVTFRNSTREVGHISENNGGLRVNGAGEQNALTLSTGGTTRVLIKTGITFYGDNGTSSYVFARGGIGEIQAKVNFQNITQNRQYNFPDNTGTVVLGSTLSSTIASKGVGTVGTYAFLTLRDTTGDKAAGITQAGSNLRYSNANASTSGTPNGTWRLMGRLAGDSGNSEPKETSVWLRIS
jgi:hypothetical protein